MGKDRKFSTHECFSVQAVRQCGKIAVCGGSGGSFVDLCIENNVDLYITGSNAFLLSGELATLLSGRYVEIKMLPLSFKEYVSAFQAQSNIERVNTCVSNQKH